MRCLLGLEWDDEIKMCVTNSRTCQLTPHDGHMTSDHAPRPDDPPPTRQFDASWLQADEVFHRRQPAMSDGERHELHHLRHNDVIY